MATVATRREKKTLSNEKNKRTDLTPTGLLMEGHYTQNAPAKAFECNGEWVLKKSRRLAGEI